MLYSVSVRTQRITQLSLMEATITESDYYDNLNS